MTTELARPDPATVLERVIIEGDLSRLKDFERINYYNAVCESLGLNPYTKPFDYLRLSDKLTLYATKNATDQLRRIHGISVTKLEVSDVQGVYVVTAYGKDSQGRIDSAQGAVYVKNLQGDYLANAIMKAETKAKRRLTLSMCGLGFMDVSEVETVADARRVAVDHVTGEVLDEPQPAASVVGDVLVRSADERVWQRYVEVLGVAQGLGIRVKPMRLPLGRQVLIDEGQRLVQAIDERKAELQPEPNPDLDAALTENQKLLADAMGLRVPGLGKYRADRSWSLEWTEQANAQLRELMQERMDEADLRAAAGQAELPA
jgi:hypothetical protein